MIPSLLSVVGDLTCPVDKEKFSWQFSACYYVCSKYYDGPCPILENLYIRMRELEDYWL